MLTRECRSLPGSGLRGHTLTNRVSTTLADLTGIPWVERDASGHLSITFLRRKSTTSPGITYLVEAANELLPAPWDPVTATPEVVSIDSIWERVTVTDPVSFEDGDGERYLRLKVE